MMGFKVIYDCAHLACAFVSSVYTKATSTTTVQKTAIFYELAFAALAQMSDVSSASPTSIQTGTVWATVSATMPAPRNTVGQMVDGTSYIIPSNLLGVS